MKLFKKSTLSMAMSLAMVGGIAVSQQAQAVPQAPAAPGDPYVANNGLGQALLFPLYTVRENYQTLLDITNTSDRTVALKVRFREKMNSRDVLDFNIVMSPKDRWGALVNKAADGRPQITSFDTTCVAPRQLSPAVSFRPVSYTSYNDARDAVQGSAEEILRLQEGHFEIIPMGVAINETSSVPFNAKHVVNATTGVSTPRNCGIVAAAFNAPASVGSLDYAAMSNGGIPLNTTFTDSPTIGAAGDGDPTAVAQFEAFPEDFNPLTGSLVIRDREGGIAGGAQAIAIADFMVPGAVGDASTNLITAMRLPFFLEPTLASRDGLWSSTGLGLVEDALSSTNVANTWVNNPDNNGRSDWAVTFPTKFFHVDAEADNIQAGDNAWRDDGLNTGGDLVLAPFEAAWSAAGSRVSIGDANGSAWNSEEQTRTTTPLPGDFSPAEEPGVPGAFLPWETNIINFDASGEGMLASYQPVSLGGVMAGIAGGNTSGWLDLSFPNATDAALPVIGFAMTEKRTQDASTNYGQMINHSLDGE